MNDQPAEDGHDDAAEALGIARDLYTLVGRIDGRLAEMTRYGHRTRMISWGLSILLALDLSLTAVAGLVLINERRLSAQIHQSQLQGCAIGDQFRAGQRQLWDHVIAVSTPPPHETAAEREKRLAKITAFRVYIARQFRPVDCRKLYG